jgi:UDP-glucose 4-epimerase
MTAGERWLVVGGAGFLGSHFVDRLLGSGEAAAVTVYDNFSSGQEWHLEQHRDDDRLVVQRADVGELDTLATVMRGHDAVIHLASNPDIARAAVEPTIDFDQGTVLTQNVVEAMRVTETPRILYASGSGVYGDLGETAIGEDWGPLLPISTYGASKLAGETLISAYAAMFGLKGRSFRFGNVVGPRQTHGVGFDFVRSLLADPARLRILGDGSQRKSYIHVLDVVDAVLLADGAGADAYDVYNVATGDEITVAEIADLAAEAVGLSPAEVEYDYAGGDRGWRGDVPVVRLQIDKIKGLGWKCSRSTRDALRESLDALVSETRARRSA